MYVTQRKLRPALRNIEWLSTLNCQKIALSATIPPSLESMILKSVGLHPSNPVIREPSVQRQIKYHLLSVPNQSAALCLLTAVEDFLVKQVLGKGRQGVIFFKGTESCEDYAKQKGHACNHSKQLSAEKEVEMEKFLSGRSRWLCATPGIAAGVSVSTIDITLFLGLPYGMIDFYQSCGRGSREGGRSDAIVIHIQNDRRLADPLKDTDVQLWRPLVEWSKGNHVCDRSFITQHLDGHPYSCKDLPSSELCCRCQPDALDVRLHSLQAETPSGSTAPMSDTRVSSTPSDDDEIQRGKRKEGPNGERDHAAGVVKRAKTEPLASRAGDTHLAAALARLACASKQDTSRVRFALIARASFTPDMYMQQMLGDALQQFQNKCIFCLVVNKRGTETANNDVCTSCAGQSWRSVETKIGKTYPAWRKEDVNYGRCRPFFICFSCHTPQSPFEPPGHTGFSNGSRKHIYKGIMCRAAYLVYGHFGFKNELTPCEFGRWLVEESESEFTNMVSVFLRIYTHVFQS